MYKFIFLVLLILIEIYAKNLPSFLKKCHLHESVNKCVEEDFERIRPYFIKGIPELKVPPIDPLFLEKVEYSGENFRLSFLNISMIGAKNYKVKEVTVDPDNVYIHMKILFPNVICSTRYSVNGKILMLELKGDGDAIIDMSDMVATGDLKGFYEKRKGKDYINFNDKKLNLEFGKGRFNFTNIFANNPQLTETTNSIINENVDEILNEFKPAVEDVVLKFLVQIIDGVFNSYSLEDLFILD